ncbi:TrkH family potassium uptake protein [bacterium]|nr:TrkH family potassium uptake protein [bacterium]
MNILTILKPLVLILFFVSLFMAIPAATALYYDETAAFQTFVQTMFSVAAVCAVSFYFLRRWQIHRVALKESFILVVLCWFSVSFISALPFYISDAIPNFSEAFFETVSGFSTTGATILTDIESLPKSMLMWRSLVHWLGGMGIIVLAVAVLPLLGVGGLQLLKAEAPGPTVDKISPRISETAKILWGIYVGMTIVEAMLLNFAGMNYFDAFIHSFSTVSTGGFSSKNDSIAAFPSPLVQWIIIVFMILSGASFTLHYKLIMGKAKQIFKSTELKVYLVIILVVSVLVTITLYLKDIYPLKDSFRHSMFQVSSILTTTGFATADYEMWPNFAQFLIFMLMFLGGCSGSTSGGIKLIRIVTLVKLAFNEMKYLIHPKAVMPIFIDGNVIKKDMIYSISAFVFLYMCMVLFTTFICAVSGEDLITSFTAALTTVGNVGPGFGKIGPTDNFHFFSDWVKWFLSAAMIIGRLEVYTVMVIFTRAFWKK